jgi:hypothetical protein
MRRAALLILVVGAPLLLFLFPKARRALSRRLRMVFLVYVAIVLAMAAWSFASTWSSGRLGDSEKVIGAAFSALVLVALLLAVRDFLHLRR